MCANEITSHLRSDDAFMILMIVKWRLVSSRDWFQYVTDFLVVWNVAQIIHVNRSKSTTADIRVPRRARKY